MRYSWILPSFNEESSLRQLLNEIKSAMGNQNNYEVLVVNDCSTDHTAKRLQEISKTDKKVNVISLPIRQGKWAALRAGIEKSTGDIVITLDADLQDDPKELKKMLSFTKSYSLVSGWRQNRKDPLYKVLISKIGSHILGFHDLNSPFKIYHRSVIEKLPKEGSLLRFSLFYAKQFGFQTIEVPIVHRPRIFGKSKFGLVKYIRIIYDLILINLLFTGSGKISR